MTSWSRTWNLGTSTSENTRTTFNEQQRNGCGNVFSLKIESHMHTLTQSLLIAMWSRNVIFIGCLKRLERVLRCRSVCETMEDYKEGYLMVWANYITPFSSIVGLYFKGTCDAISVTLATHKVHKSVLYISVSVNYLKN